MGRRVCHEPKRNISVRRRIQSDDQYDQGQTIKFSSAEIPAGLISVIDALFLRLLIIKDKSCVRTDLQGFSETIKTSGG